jgi:hypothetical protein
MLYSYDFIKYSPKFDNNPWENSNSIFSIKLGIFSIKSQTLLLDCHFGINNFCKFELSNKEGKVNYIF